jgi:hypothetical protein
MVVFIFFPRFLFVSSILDPSFPGRFVGILILALDRVLHLAWPPHAPDPSSCLGGIGMSILWCLLCSRGTTRSHRTRCPVCGHHAVDPPPGVQELHIYGVRAVLVVVTRARDPAPKLSTSGFAPTPRRLGCDRVIFSPIQDDDIHISGVSRPSRPNIRHSILTKCANITNTSLV